MSRQINKEDKENESFSNINRLKSPSDNVLIELNQINARNEDLSFINTPKRMKTITGNALSSRPRIEQKSEIGDDALNLFKALLKGCTHTIDFINHGQADEFPLMSGLMVEKMGYIATPLTDAQVQQIMDLQNNSGERNSDKYEISGKFLKTLNPSWNANLNKLAEKIAKEMGIVNEIICVVLDKMVVYRRGNKIVHLNEVESAYNIDDQSLCKFANIELKLPSVFKGGEILAQYKDFKQKYDLGTNPLFSIKYAARDPRVNVNINPIVDGYRLTLEYSLYCQVNSRPSVNLDENFSRIEKMSNFLMTISQCLKKVWVLLENQYDTQSLLSKGPRNEFKADDLHRFNLLGIANNRLPQDKQFIFLVAHLERCLCYDDGDFRVSWGSSQNGGYDKSDGEDSVNSDFDLTENGRRVMEDDFEVNELIDKWEISHKRIRVTEGQISFFGKSMRY